MGHDISGYNKENKEVVYTRYGSWNEGARHLYRVLDVQSLDGGVSGVGEEIYFDENQIRNAISRAETIDWSNIEQTEPEYEKDKLAKFLDGLLCIATNEDKVKVYFG
ncbi:hypothetical protein D3C74_231200 [compost metagenome]